MRKALVLATLMLAACGRGEQVARLPSPDGNPTITCADEDFAAAVLDEPGGAEREEGAAEDALRDTIENPPPDGHYSDPATEIPASGWRAIARESDRVAFVTGEAPELTYVVVEEKKNGRWGHTRVGGCRTVVRRNGLDPANWALDPSVVAPGPDSTVIRVLVDEPACHGFESVVPRLQESEIRYGEDIVTIALYVQPLSGIATCPGAEAEPTTVTLAEPLGHRRLLDGGRYPPAVGEVLFPPGSPPSPPRSE